MLEQFEGSRLDKWELVLARDKLDNERELRFLLNPSIASLSNRDKSLDDPRKFYKKKGVELGKKGKKNIGAAKGGDEQRRRWRWGGTHTDRLGNMGEVKAGAPPSSSPSSSLPLLSSSSLSLSSTSSPSSPPSLLPSSSLTSLSWSSPLSFPQQSLR